MNFDYTPKVRELRERLLAFMTARVYPNERRYRDEVEATARNGNPWIPTRLVEELKVEARAAGAVEPVPAAVGARRRTHQPRIRAAVPSSWVASRGRRRSSTAARPTPGNMETIERYGTAEQKRQWLEPLLEGEIRSAFLMTEPAVASSDATNIECSMVRDGDHYVINGRKWWSSGAGDPRCAHLHRDGQDRSGRAEASPAIDAARARRDAGDQGASGRSPCSTPTTRRTGTWRSISSTCACPRPTC